MSRMAHDGPGLSVDPGDAVEEAERIQAQVEPDESDRAHYFRMCVAVRLVCENGRVSNQLPLSRLSPSTRRLFHSSSVESSVALSARFSRLSTCDRQALRATLCKR